MKTIDVDTTSENSTIKLLGSLIYVRKFSKVNVDCAVPYLYYLENSWVVKIYRGKNYTVGCQRKELTLQMAAIAFNVFQN